MSSSDVTVPLPQSAALNISSQFTETLIVLVCIPGLYFCSSGIIAVPFAAAWALLQLLILLITDADPPFSEWTFIGILFQIWALIFVLGLSIEVLAYAGWLLMRVSRRRGRSSQKYNFLARKVWWAVSVAIHWIVGSDPAVSDLSEWPRDPAVIGRNMATKEMGITAL